MSNQIAQLQFILKNRTNPIVKIFLEFWTIPQLEARLQFLTDSPPGEKNGW